MNPGIILLTLITTLDAFSFGVQRHETNQRCNQRCQRSSNPWSVKSLRLHLSKKLQIHPSDIKIPGAFGILDIGSCAGTCRNGGQCHPASRTPIIFEVFGKPFTSEEYFIIDSCSCVSELHNPQTCN
ncbi:Oidioi.mRNA.OKI2018_I69.chr1.g1076.t1.cds [Oikopleura dioica]|uniref:Oidioi.mRNA.OKI2018_I69.chr1.g1076.t1.cds n=1 Tax=Oikopleura dioica TaxID=34765 RepID=A0ABN7SLT7_OIKDI|nr:Oidioi.mRNA.OKI2018_I69.chr1.g1076.t1.cds [Oikopleura dioica]